MSLPQRDNLVRIGQLKAEYEGDLDVDEALVHALIRMTQTVPERVPALGRLNP